jgi:hypothetical protein
MVYCLFPVDIAFFLLFLVYPSINEPLLQKGEIEFLKKILKKD